MPKVNQEEYRLLKEIKRNGFEEIRRNSTGDIAVRVVGDKVTSHQYQTEHNDKFKFMEPTGDYWSIAELIEEYEEDYKGSWEHAIEFSKEMRRESEETEVKNIEWLKRSIDKRIKTIESDDISFVGSEYYDEGYIDGMRDVLYRINQLDEPEASTQELPVIPNYVAKWISVHHEQFDLYPALKRLENNALSWEDVYEWYRRNTYIFVNAYLTGKYEVEEEPKYYVVDNEYIPLLQKGHGYVNRTSTGLSIFEKGRDNDQFALTEQEIKDYDERYWAFAKPVEELEE